MFLRIIHPKLKTKKDAQRNRTSYLRQKKTDFVFELWKNNAPFEQLVCAFSYEFRKNKPAWPRIASSSQTQTKTHRGIEPHISAIKRDFLFSNCGNMMHLRAVGLRFLVRIEKKQSNCTNSKSSNQKSKPKKTHKGLEPHICAKKRDFLIPNCGKMMHLQLVCVFSHKLRKNKPACLGSVHHPTKTKKDAQRNRTSYLRHKKRDFCFCC